VVTNDAGTIVGLTLFGQTLFQGPIALGLSAPRE
jgi:hypothetical protein